MNWSESILFNQHVSDIRPVADPIPQHWEELLAQREQAGFLRGQLEGERAVSARLLDQRTEMAGLQRGVLEALSRAVPQVIEATEATLLHLALESARKVVGGLPITTELIEAVVREALGQVKETADVIIQLHPDDLAALRNNNSELLKGESEAGRLRFVAKPDLARGDCVAQTRFGVVDARREAKFQHISETLASS